MCFTRSERRGGHGVVYTVQMEPACVRKIVGREWKSADIQHVKAHLKHTASGGIDCGWGEHGAIPGQMAIRGINEQEVGWGSSVNPDSVFINSPSLRTSPSKRRILGIGWR